MPLAHRRRERRARAGLCLASILVLASAALAQGASLPRPWTAAVYVPGTLAFSQNVTLLAPVTVTDGEPSVRVDVRGNCYVAGIQGVPAGVDMWRFDLDPASPTFDPGMQNPVYLGKPDAFINSDPQDTTVGGADGGGDVDLSVSFPTNPDSIPVLTVTSLALANISTAVTRDRGATFTRSPGVVPVPADDRMWNESDGDNLVYMVYRAPIPATALWATRSTDHGMTFPQTGLVNASGTTPGYIDVDHATGRVYISHRSSTTLVVGRSTDGGLTWANSTVDNTTAHGALFDVVKVGDDGTVYTVWSDRQNIWFSRSTDGGVTWSGKIRVNDNTVYKTNLMPWVEAGSGGRVDFVWYGTTNPGNVDAADWVVLFAQTLNAKDANPTFAQQVISDHVIHGSNISILGLGGAANRNILDYFQVAIDPQGAAVVAYTDDHNDFFGNVYVTRQLDGASLYASANGTGFVTPASPPPLPPPSSIPEITDFLRDATTGLVQANPVDNPWDILSVDYDCTEDQATGSVSLVTTMTVSKLAPIPPVSNWRMSFSANAANGVSDRGDQFFFRANTDNSAVPTFFWGTAVRNSDGSLSYTARGNADFGELDTLRNTITIRKTVDSLNALVTHGPPIGPGSVLHGLRGGAFSSGANAERDITRGGPSYTITCGLPTSVHDGDNQTPDAPRPASFLGAPQPNPSRGSVSFRFMLLAPGDVEVTVFDMSGRRVRSIQSGSLAGGSYTRTWDGNTDHFTKAAPGVYVLTLRTAAGTSTQRVALIR